MYLVPGGTWSRGVPGRGVYLVWEGRGVPGPGGVPGLGGVPGPGDVPGPGGVPGPGVVVYLVLGGVPGLGGVYCRGCQVLPPCEQNDKQVRKYYLAPNFICGRYQ